jgi:uncharacterized Zn finger protein
MCKHVAAVLYGVGARLDERPQLLFVLRGVDENELLAGVGQDLPLTRAMPSAAKVLDDSDVAALFGLEMTGTTGIDTPTPPAPKRPPRSKTTRKSWKPVKTRPPAARKGKPPRTKRTRPKPTP